MPLLLVVFFSLEFVRNNQCLFEHFFERKHANPQVILFIEIPQLVITVVAGRDADCRTGCPNLLSLYLACLQNYGLK